MKRVLNSGSIKLPYIQGSEKDLLESNHRFSFYKNLSQNEMIEDMLSKGTMLGSILFTFEIKMSVLVAQTFYDAKLGSLTAQEGPNYQIAYLPQQYFKESSLGSTIMDAKACNDYNTKLNNFYNWSFNFYNKLIEGGVDKSQAALVLPQGVFRTFIWQVNAKDLILFIEQNVNKSPEIRGYCGTLVLYLEDHLPQVTQWLKANKWKDLI